MSATERETLARSADFREPTRHLPAQQNVGNVERWVSAVGGGALTAFGLLQRSVPGAALAALGGALVYRGVSGSCPAYKALGVGTGKQAEGVSVKQAFVINRSPQELYTFWRNFENLPQFMEHLEAVTVQGSKRSHWVATAPGGTTVEWDANITEDRPNELIAWHSTEDADVENRGTVRFTATPDAQGTRVDVDIVYNPPAGKLGSAVAWLFGEEPNQQVSEDLRRFKRLMETGEIATTSGQPHGKRSALGKLLSPTS